MELEQIKAAVKAGKRVFWQNSGYEVILDSKGQWLIQCAHNRNCLGLTWHDGVTVNGRPEDFFVLVDETEPCECDCGYNDAIDGRCQRCGRRMDDHDTELPNPDE